jgi:hypothetical protein
VVSVRRVLRLEVVGLRTGGTGRHPARGQDGGTASPVPVPPRPPAPTEGLLFSRRRETFGRARASVPSSRLAPTRSQSRARNCPSSSHSSSRSQNSSAVGGCCPQPSTARVRRPRPSRTTSASSAVTTDSSPGLEVASSYTGAGIIASCARTPDGLILRKWGIPSNANANPTPIIIVNGRSYCKPRIGPTAAEICCLPLVSPGVPAGATTGGSGQARSASRDSWQVGTLGFISGRGANCGQLRTAVRVAKWRTRPPHATQDPGGHMVTAEKRVRHPAPRVANSPRGWPRRVCDR